MSLLEVRKINKSFGSNKVLTDVSISFEAGEIHSIVGENGAGKSTLMKIIGGIHACDSGEILVDGHPVQIHSPSDAFKHGIGIVHQELSIAGNMTVAQNVFVNREPTNKWGFINWAELYEKTNAEFEKIGVKIDPKVPAGSLSVGMQQIVEIVKILSQNVKILIMDEPTSALSDKEVDHLFQLLKKLKEKGTLIIFISHKLKEITYLSDRVSVLRDGRFIGTLDRENMQIPKIINMMVGRNIDQLYPEKGKKGDRKEVFRLEHGSRKGKFTDVSFRLYAGEITGMFGLVGSGRTELAYSIFGADRLDQGSMYLNGEKYEAKSPIKAIEMGIGYLSEDRKNLGLFLDMSVKDNTVVTILQKLCNKLSFLNDQQAADLTKGYIGELQIHPEDCLLSKVKNLSGGNQQKVLLAKWLVSQPKLLIVDEPTRGVDVGAKSMIHFMLRKLADQGMAILMISSELPEIIGLSDKVIVMHEGRCKGVLENVDLTEEEIMTCAFREEEDVI